MLENILNKIICASWLPGGGVVLIGAIEGTKRKI